MAHFQAALAPHTDDVIVLRLQLFEEGRGTLAKLFFPFMNAVCIKERYNAVDNQQAVLKGKWEVKSYTAEATLNGQPLPEEDVDFSGVILRRR